MSRIIAMFALLCLCSMSVACVSSRRLGQFTAASTNNVRNLNYSRKSGTKARVFGQSCYKKIFGFRIGDTDDRIQKAMDSAIADGEEAGLDGDLLVNVRIAEENQDFIVYLRNCVIVEGDLVKIKK